MKTFIYDFLKMTIFFSIFGGLIVLADMYARGAL